MLICQAIRFMSMAWRCKKVFCEYENTCYICGNIRTLNSLMCKFKDTNLGIKKLDFNVKAFKTLAENNAKNG